MRNYPEYGFGLMLNKEESKAFCKKYNVVEGENYECDDMEYYLEDCRYYTDDFDGRHFYSANKNIDNEGATGLFFFADWQPDAFKVAYYSMDDCVEEFKNKIGKYLPEDFNWEDHIGYFQAAIFC